MSRWIDFAGIVAGLILCAAFIYSSRPVTDVSVTDSSVTFRICNSAAIPVAEKLVHTLEQSFYLTANITGYDGRRCFSGSLHCRADTHPAMRLMLSISPYRQVFEQFCRQYISNYGRIDREMAGKISAVVADLLVAN